MAFFAILNLMKKTTLSSLILLLLLACDVNHTPKNAAISEKEVTTCIEQFFEALANSDSLLLKQTLSKDFYMFEHDEIWNTDSLLALMPATLGRKWSVNEERITIIDNTGHISYFNQGIIPPDRSWLESALVVKENGSTKVVFLHSTKLYLK